MDNHLNVDNPRFLKPRKSVIGKLERSSFQTQRLSDVGTAFSQQITAKVGLKLPASQERIVEQTRWLYLRYVFVKLRQNKLPLRDLNLTKSSRARRAAALGLNGYGLGSEGGMSTGIVVSVSEPPTACVQLEANNNTINEMMDDDPHAADEKADLYSDIDVSPFLARRTRPQALSVSQINPQDLNLLAARMSVLAASALSAPNRRPGRIYSQKQHSISLADNPSPTLNLIDSSGSHSHSLGSTINPVTGGVGTASATFNTAANTNRKFMMDSTINNQIFTVIMNTMAELRELKPEFYCDTVYEVIGMDKFSSLDSLLEVQKTICQEMTRIDISWDRIIALFSLFGAMSLDCVRLGSPEHVGPILDGFIGFVERDLALWISQQGGWESFLYKCRAGYHFGPIHKAVVVLVPVMMWMIFCVFN